MNLWQKERGKTTQCEKRLRPSSPRSISEFEDKNFVYQKIKNYSDWRKSWRECDISDFETSDPEKMGDGGVRRNHRGGGEGGRNYKVP